MSDSETSACLNAEQQLHKLENHGCFMSSFRRDCQGTGSNAGMCLHLLRLLPSKDAIIRCFLPVPVSDSCPIPTILLVYLDFVPEIAWIVVCVLQPQSE